jgi:hypothetical protein
MVVTPWSVSHNTQLFGTNHSAPMMILTGLVNQPHNDPWRIIVLCRSRQKDLSKSCLAPQSESLKQEKG